MTPRSRRRFLGKEEEARVVAAIKGAEAGNRGEVRVHIERTCAVAALERARALFAELRMVGTAEATGVLLYVAVDDRKAAVFAGSGIHGAEEPVFWQRVIDAVADGFRRGKAVDGLVDALGAIGDLLRRVVPGPDTAGNELPDEVTYR